MLLLDQERAMNPELTAAVTEVGAAYWHAKPAARYFQDAAV